MKRELIKLKGHNISTTHQFFYKHKYGCDIYLAVVSNFNHQ